LPPQATSSALLSPYVFSFPPPFTDTDLFLLHQGYLIKTDVPVGDYAAYRPAIFYAGALSLVSAALVLVVRLQLSRKVFKRM
jgi:hypothetical protein